MTAHTLLSAAETRIATSRNIEHWQPGLARWDADVLMAHVLQTRPDDADMPTRAISTAQRKRFEVLVDRRLTGEPVSYITGSFTFCGLQLMVRPGVFSPRASSELTVEHAVSRLRRRRGRRLAVDVATGSGAIALAIGARVVGSEVWGIDISPEAARLGRANARKLALGNVRFAVGDMLAALPGQVRGAVGLFTIHPPYVGRREVRTLPVEIRRFEPHSTLTDGSEDGLGLVRRLASDAPSWLRPGGLVMVEIAPYLARATATVLRRAGFGNVRSHRDGLGVTRVVIGQL
ncbi:MAG: peptide chain release factor N(5)-glutamine methyltransferase [Candidatus Dormibacteraeota bacterium]|uniref:Peptide chain release factor N(5)-glutamine methyltransferase n=1 Tax=Candidatus Amunia macphersoniae TaxID=3127014 RepID=A0A934KQV9_9BACT|nr:peptide chain release factor N(5)-glutamine methyltransferase [Candidatus Dormibacteraeota bacterium]